MAQHRQYTKYILLQHYKHQRYGIYYRDVVAHRACVCVCVCLYSTAAAPKQKKNTEKNLRAAEVEAAARRHGSCCCCCFGCRWHLTVMIDLLKEFSKPDDVQPPAEANAHKQAACVATKTNRSRRQTHVVKLTCPRFSTRIYTVRRRRLNSCNCYTTVRKKYSLATETNEMCDCISNSENCENWTEIYMQRKATECNCLPATRECFYVSSVVCLLYQWWFLPKNWWVCEETLRSHCISNVDLYRAYIMNTKFSKYTALSANRGLLTYQYYCK